MKRVIFGILLFNLMVSCSSKTNTSSALDFTTWSIDIIDYYSQLDSVLHSGEVEKHFVDEFGIELSYFEGRLVRIVQEPSPYGRSKREFTLGEASSYRIRYIEQDKVGISNPKDYFHYSNSLYFYNYTLLEHLSFSGNPIKSDFKQYEESFGMRLQTLDQLITKEGW